MAMGIADPRKFLGDFVWMTLDLIQWISTSVTTITQCRARRG
ncbi:MAG TPA: hypothetical protein VFO36_09460 [Nitrospiraceae bacterium]|nr:hypothetical protein [Nitrospiraceae bacterium]